MSILCSCMKMLPCEFLQCSFGCFQSITCNEMSSDFPSELSSKELRSDVQSAAVQWTQSSQPLPAAVG